MVNLSEYGEVSIMILKIEPTKDCEHKRQADEKHWSMDYRILTALLERGKISARRKSKVVDADFAEMDAKVIAVDPIGDCVLAVYWQTPEQAATNPQFTITQTAREIEEPLVRKFRVGPDTDANV